MAEQAIRFYDICQDEIRPPRLADFADDALIAAISDAVEEGRASNLRAVLEDANRRRSRQLLQSIPKQANPIDEAFRLYYADKISKADLEKALDRHR